MIPSLRDVIDRHRPVQKVRVTSRKARVVASALREVERAVAHISADARPHILFDAAARSVAALRERPIVLLWKEQTDPDAEVRDSTLWDVQAEYQRLANKHRPPEREKPEWKPAPPARPLQDVVVEKILAMREEPDHKDDPKVWQNEALEEVADIVREAGADADLRDLADRVRRLEITGGSHADGFRNDGYSIAAEIIDHVSKRQAAPAEDPVIEYVRDGVCLLCGDGVTEDGEHLDPDRHAAEVERIVSGALRH